MSSFQQIQNSQDIKQTLNATFNVDLSLDGGWGYIQEEATIIEALKDGMSPTQLEHMIVTMRTHLEMNIIQEKTNRYAGINANEKSRESLHTDNTVIDKVSYEITAIKEDLYHAFVKEYKEGYESEAFDLSDHFRRRKEATLIREVVHYFDITHIK